MSGHTHWLEVVERSGLVLSEPVLEEHLPDGPEPVPAGLHNWFRRQAERYLLLRDTKDADRRKEAARAWSTFLLETMLALPPEHWVKAIAVPDALRVRLDEYDQWLEPDRVVMGPKGPVLPVLFASPDQDLDRPDRTPGRWKASPATKLDALLRATGLTLGLVTNGDEVRLVSAQPGLSTGFIGWTSRTLIEDKPALDAFTTLLGRDRLVPARPEAVTLADLCRLSVDRQVEVADQLGQQVRDGVERLLWALDEADRTATGELLAGLTEDQLYEMALVVMMRLVFVLYAEERRLLPHGEVLYDQGYGLTWLWHRLQEQRREDAARMADTHDAWARFLALSRLIHRGCRHPDLSLIAYGGSLFDASRFPVLEDPRCRVSNRVMAEVLQRLLFARQTKAGEPQRVGYWALGEEQIGYLYEGLLDHRCARAGDQSVVKLRGADEASLPLNRLEQATGEALVVLVADETGRTSERDRARIAQRLAEPPDLDALTALARFPAEVAVRVRPYANVVQCDEVVPPGWRYLTTGTSRRASGAHYTPPTLTAPIVKTTLEPLVYRCEEGKPGLYLEPRQVKLPFELLDLKVADIAMGSGAFLVQVIRYLGDRLVEAWDRALVQAGPKGKLTMPFARPSTGAPDERLIDPENRAEMVLWARRYVAERCVYGVDVNPLAAEMARLSLWLVTVSKDRPFTFLDHALRCGDSLVGVTEAQLATWSLDGKSDTIPMDVHAVREQLARARTLRNRLREFPVLAPDDAARKADLLRQAEAAVASVRVAADLLVAPEISSRNKDERKALSEIGLELFKGKSPDHAKAVADKLLTYPDGPRKGQRQRTFHWFLEFPEVFDEGREGFDAIVGNPPFMGGQKLTGNLGTIYRDWLVERVGRGKTGSADLVSYMFLSAFDLLRCGGQFGLIATNTIAQGDTRENGLDQIVKAGGTIRAAVKSMTTNTAAN